MTKKTAADEAAAEAEAAEVPAAAEGSSAEDLARGYRITQWNGRPNYEALDGSMATLDEAQIRAHVRRRGLIQE